MAIDSRNTFVYSPLDITTSTGSSTGAAIPVASVAASGTAGIFQVCKRATITVSVSSSGVQPPVSIQLFNGASSTGTVLATWQVTPQNGSASGANGCLPTIVLDMDNLHIPGSTANTAMCLSGSANMGAGTLASLQLYTYVFPKANFKTVTNAA